MKNIRVNAPIHHFNVKGCLHCPVLLSVMIMYFPLFVYKRRFKVVNVVEGVHQEIASYLVISAPILVL